MDFKKMINNVIQGDCLEVMKAIPEKSINMIICDLPYGYTKNKWDSKSNIINLEELWTEYKRIIKDNGVIALTAQGMFTAKLMIEGGSMFKYKMVWIKSKSTNFLNANKQPLRRHEDICIFYKKQPVYHPQKTAGEPYDKGTRKDQPSSSYGKFKPVHVKSDGQRYPNDVLVFDDETEIFLDEDNILYQPDDYHFSLTAEIRDKVYHPTQKPVSLGSYLIKTYTNEGDLVLDNTCGSGSFLVAAALENRKFIGIEKNENVYHHENKVDFISICKERLNAVNSNFFPNLNKKTKNKQNV